MNSENPDQMHSIGFERLVFFSDAVFAIAITLLVLDLRIPDGGLRALTFGSLEPKLLGFVISFFVIGIYWLAHHELFTNLVAEDGLTRLANLVFLAAIVFLPFPTSIIAESRPNVVSVEIYAAAVAVTGLLFLVLGLVASRSAMQRPGIERHFRTRMVLRSMAAPAVFALSIAVAQSRPLLAMVSWSAVFPLVWILPAFGSFVLRRR